MCVRMRILIVMLAIAICNVQCVRFYLQPNTEKCLREEIMNNYLVLVHYEASEVPKQVVDCFVRKHDNVIVQKHNIKKGKLHFVSNVYDVYDFCFTSKVPQNHRAIAHEISLQVTILTLPTKDFDTI